MIAKTLTFGFVLILAGCFLIVPAGSNDDGAPNLSAFQSLEDIPADTTREALVVLAKKRFGNPPEIDEWTRLCFSLRRDGHGEISVLKRFAELHVQMLTDADAETYAEEIRAYQGALKEIEDLSQMINNPGSKSKISLQLPFAANTAAASQPGKSRPLLFSSRPESFATDNWEKAALKHLVQFNTLKEKAPAAARPELLEIANIRFGTHILVDEWIALYFRLSSEGNGRFSDLQRLAELEIRMLTEIDAETHAEQIQLHRQTLETSNRQIQILKSKGVNPETLNVNF